MDVAISHNIEKKYDSTTLNSIFMSLIKSIIESKEEIGEFTITNPTAKQEREDAERIFFAGKLTDAYLKFIHAADTGDARACYFVACYYNNAYGTTQLNEELYKNYIDLGVSRRDPFCYLEYALYLSKQGDKDKSEYWQSKTLTRVAKLADRGDVVACNLILEYLYEKYKIEYLLLDDNNEKIKEVAKKNIGSIIGAYRKYSEKALDAGYWPVAYRNCYSFASKLTGENREKNIEKYGWMFEKVEWAEIQLMLAHRFLTLDKDDNKYYKNAASCFVTAYKFQKEESICGFISFFLNAGVIKESIPDGIEKKDLKILYYKGLNSKTAMYLYSLGDLYFKGVGENHLGMNKESAFEHFSRAFEKFDTSDDFWKKYDRGKSATAYTLGYMLSNGIGTEQNKEKAVSYYKYAVQNGEKRAIKPLAYCYLKGIGVKKDLNKYNELIAMVKEE